MTVVAYVSGHGFGHSAREVEILRRLPEEIPLVVKSAAPEWFWRQEVPRPFEFVQDSYDVGCVQTSSLEVDVPATLAAWQTVGTRNRIRFADEVRDLRQREARVVVTDVAPFPLSVAEALGIPGLCIANFTWADIYAEYVKEEPGFVPVVAAMEAEYSRATLMLETGLALPMRYFPRRECVGLVARSGTPRRAELLEMLGPGADGKRLALVYAGNWGLPVPWERVERFSDWHFLSLNPFETVTTNSSQVAQGAMPHPDFVASVDLVISKVGYGITGECLTAGTPLLYCPRFGFAEYSAIDSVLAEWPGRLYLPSEAFLSADWGDILKTAPMFGSVRPRPASGGGAAAAQIRQFWSAGL
jgi:L-arabinokinase